MAENTSFANASKVVYRGSQGIEILQDPEIVGYDPRKWPEMQEIMSFADTTRVVYKGTNGIKILPGPENHGL